MGTELARVGAGGPPVAVATALKPVMDYAELARMSQAQLIDFAMYLQSQDAQIVRFGPDGRAIRWVKRRVMLQLHRDVQIIEGRPNISVAGWNRLNAVVGIVFRQTDDVVVDGHPRPNPYVEQDPLTHQVRRVHYRLIGVGRTQAGNRTAMDYTVVYDLAAYLLADLHAKLAKKGASSGIDFVVRRTDAEPEDGKLFLPDVVQPGTSYASGLALDFSKGVVRDVFLTNAQRRNFAVQRAISACQRNLLKKMIGMEPEQATDGNWYVTVTGWIHADDDVISRIAVAPAPGTILEAETIEVTKETELIVDVEDVGTDGDVVSGADTVSDASPGGAAGPDVPPAASPAKVRSSPVPVPAPSSPVEMAVPESASTSVAERAANEPGIDNTSVRAQPTPTSPPALESATPAAPVRPDSSIPPGPVGPAAATSGGADDEPPREGPIERRRRVGGALRSALATPGLDEARLDAIYAEMDIDRAGLRRAPIEVWERLLERLGRLARPQDSDAADDGGAS